VPTASLVQIGKVVDGKFQVNDAAMRNVPQGSLVYITKP
jgi:hypothetical protein